MYVVSTCSSIRRAKKNKKNDKINSKNVQDRNAKRKKQKKNRKKKKILEKNDILTTARRAEKRFCTFARLV